MRQLTGIIIAVGKGEVSLRMSNGFHTRFKTKGSFKKAQKVVIYFDYENYKIVDIKHPHELDLEDPVPVQSPEQEHTEEPVPDELKLEGSLPLPAVAAGDSEQEPEEWE